MAPKFTFVKVMKIVKGIFEKSMEEDPDKRPVLKEVKMSEAEPGYFTFPWAIRADVFQSIFVKECGMEAYKDVQRSLESGNQSEKGTSA